MLHKTKNSVLRFGRSRSCSRGFMLFFRVFHCGSGRGRSRHPDSREVVVVVVIVLPKNRHQICKKIKKFKIC